MILLRRLRIQAFKQLANVSIEFPRRGSILVEGANEAGKSTLFEAVFFALYGRPLVGEEDRPSLEDIIPHDGASASVTLHVLTGETALEIRRTVARGQAGRSVAQKVLLRVSRPGEPVEEIATTRAADERIEQELHGLNGDTLRNSCFMEQKALDRIESLDRERREASIARLLGIGQIQKIEKDLERTLQAHTQQLARCQAELEVAEARHAASGAERAETEASERLRAAQVRALLVARDGHAGDTAGARRAETEAQATRAALVARLDEAARLRALQDELAAAGAVVEQARRAAHAEAGARTQLDALDRLERDDLPPLRARLDALAAASTALSARNAAQSRLTALEQALTACDTAEQARQMEADAEHALVAARAEAARLTAGETLARWARLKETETLIREGEAKEREGGGQREALTLRQTAARAAARRALHQVAALALLLLATGIAGALLWHPTWLATLLLLVGGTLTVRRLLAARSSLRSADSALMEAVRAAEELRARRDTARHLAGLLDELPRLEADLLAARIPIPKSPAAVSAPARAPDNSAAADSARRNVEAVRLTLERLRAAREAAEADAHSVLAHVDALPPAPDSASATPATLDRLREQAEHARADLAIAASKLAGHLGALGLPPDAEAIAAARGAAAQELARLTARLAERELLAGEYAAATVASQKTVHAAQALLADLGGQEADRGVAVVAALDEPGAPLGLDDTLNDTLDDTDALDAAREDLAAAVVARLVALDEPGARVALGRMDERLNTLARDQDTAALSRDEQVARIRDLLAEQGIACDGIEPLAVLAARWPALTAQAHTQDTAALEQALQAARAQAHHHRERAAELARQHHLEGDQLDAEDCRQRLHAHERDQRRHALAIEMAQAVRARIVRRVIPETAVYMRSLLPELTAGRYRDVQLQSDEGSGADLRVRVWDQLAGRYVGKPLFSGGTRDQCSLALRLAFALATLPKELGAMPGFIFLDEPLSSFDAERSRALVEVLTRGTIARQFAQVVLISHSQSFPRDSMRYHVRMAGGRVAATNLPSEREAAALWDAESAVAERIV